MPTVSAAELGYAFTLPPEEAIAFFENKGYAVGGLNWFDIEAGAHAKAHTVTGVLKMDVLTDFKTALTDVLKEGQTYQDFTKNLLPTLEQKGWIGSGLVADPETGELQGKQLTPRRLRTIFDTNNASNYNAGRYVQQMENVAHRPYWERVEVMDTHTRPAHRVVHGFTARYDDPVWDFLYPPDAYGCRGRIRARSEADVEKYGLTVQSSEGRLVEVQQQYGPTTITSMGIKINGDQVYVPDAGFGFNPGKVAWQPSLEKYDHNLARQFVTDSIGGPDFARALSKLATLSEQQRYSVAVLSPEQRQQIKADRQAVTVSAPAMQEMAAAKSATTQADYLRVKSTIEQADDTIVRDELTYFCQREGDGWRVATVRDNHLIAVSLIDDISAL